MEGKTASSTRITTYHETGPGEANNSGKYFGGNLMRLMDAVGFFSAMRHVRGRMVTAAVSMFFRAPVEIGSVIICHASVNAVWSTSLEVGIRVETEDPYTGEATHVASAYVTYVGVSEDGRPAYLPPLILETDEDRRRFADATRRSAVSRLEKKEGKNSVGLLNLEVLPGSYAIHRLPMDSPMPDLSCLDSTNFVTFCRTKSEVSLIMDEDAARRICSLIPSQESRCCYSCVKVNEDDMIDKVGLLAGLSTLLASAEVPLVTVSTYETFCVLMESVYLEKVVERLTTAGHTVKRPAGD